MAKFKIGDRVRMTDDTDDDIKLGWIGTVLEDDRRPYVNWNQPGFSKWAIHEDYLELILGDNEVEQTKRRTFKQLKEDWRLKKGALWQEQCEDGTQPYEMITPESLKTSDTRTFTESDRTMIEDQPQWFIEVFKVNPEYMTAQELKEWEEFRKFKRAVKSNKREIRIVEPDRIYYGNKKTSRTFITKQRMDKILEVNSRNLTQRQKAKALGIKPATLQVYLSMARRNGLVD